MTDTMAYLQDVPKPVGEVSIADGAATISLQKYPNWFVRFMGRVLLGFKYRRLL